MRARADAAGGDAGLSTEEGRMAAEDHVSVRFQEVGVAAGGVGMMEEVGG